ncbi:hypothetical protein Tco_1078880 [Tanacetum coccineum]|uniref:Uncharacterized protein n=1 Tax=Tanacetum coccineum TaxID=301880 RepID=A0ABQ5HQS1_9ASTR
MSSMKNLDDTFNFGDQFLYDKPTEDDQEKSKVREESDSTIPDPNGHDPLCDVLASIKSQVPTVVDEYLGTKLDDSLLKILERHTADLIEKYSVLPGPESIKNQESEKKILQLPFCHALMEALIADEDAMDKEVKDRVKNHKRKHDSDNDEDDDDDEGPSAGSNQGKSSKRRRHDSGASGSAQPPTKDDEQSSKKPRDTESEHSEQSSDDIPMQDEGHVSDLEDTDNAHIPKVSTTTWFKPIPEGERPATPEPEWTIPPNDFPEPENNWANTYATTYKVPAENKLQRKTYDIGSFIKWFCRRTGKKKLCKADLEGPAFNLVDLDNSEGHQILRNVYEPLPLGGPPGQCGLWHLAMWFRRMEFYHQQNTVPSDREAVRSQMRILSVISVKVFEKYGYNYLREIILRRADYQEYKISEKDFKSLHPMFFEDLFLLNIQEKLNHLPKTDKTSLHTAVNMWIRNLDATDYYFKEDYTIVPKPRAVVYKDRNDQRKLMRLNELHKFSDGTLTRVMEKLDHMVKDFHLFEYNKGMETRKWSEDDKRRSKDFITAIEKRLQIRRIFRSLESFVGGRIRDIDYRLINRTTNNPCETAGFSNEDGNPARAPKSTRGFGRPHKGVKASANSGVMYFFTSAQDDDQLQDDVRLCLGDDLKGDLP